ncbi:hypothetical protein [Herbaspirillum sp. ST 5-3]|uniref:hypothetical protein n=1 Tax=Oxalobacteraceae TaxID=75682 RepID=UPI001FFE7C62|nr:hypothetical protein [Herbaspirillum sp. ST 5-3]
MAKHDQFAGGARRGERALLGARRHLVMRMLGRVAHLLEAVHGLLPHRAAGGIHQLLRGLDLLLQAAIGCVGSSIEACRHRTAGRSLVQGFEVGF